MGPYEILQTMDKMVNHYKGLYRDLAQVLRSYCCDVFDHDLLGYCIQVKDAKAIIFISPTLTYKEKYFTLAHEAGHLFYMKKGKVFNWSKKPRTEEQANWFALQLFRLMEIENTDYKNFYNKALNKLKTRKKSWFEI